MSLLRLPANALPTGIFDSGVGGLSVLQALRQELPHEDFVYIADSGHAPYGERNEAHVLARSKAVAKHLASLKVKALVVACNTATAAAVQLLRDEYPGLPIIGVEPALKPAVSISRTKHIGVMATRSTLASTRFQALLQAHAGMATFTLQPCDGLADAIERSARQEEKTTELIANCAIHIRAMGTFGLRNGEIDTLVLGCTHYPFAAEQIRALTGPGVQLLSTGEAVARQTRRQLEFGLFADAARPGNQGRVQLFTTGLPHALQAAASRWLGLEAEVGVLSI